MCIDAHQTGFVGEGSDYLQLIKFWPSRTLKKRVCGRAKMFGSALLQPACSVCVSLSAFFIGIAVLENRRLFARVFQNLGWGSFKSQNGNVVNSYLFDPRHNSAVRYYYK